MRATSLTLSSDELAQLLVKAAHEPRRNAKRWLKDRGGVGSAEELDRTLEIARQDAVATTTAERIERERTVTSRNIELGMEARVAEMLADITVRMAEQGLTQSEVAARCGWQQPLVAAYLRGAKEPGARNLAKLAAAVGRVWRLVPIDRL